jgi:hypothetical protein
MNILQKWMLVLSAAGLLAGCGGGHDVTHPDPPPPPTPGVLTISLTTPAADDRAIMVTVSGPSIGAVSSANGAYTVYTYPDNGSVRAAVFGPLASGALLRFAVPDTRASGSYSASINDVAAASNQLRSLGAGYALTVGP